MPGTHPRQYLVGRRRNVLYHLQSLYCYQIAFRTDAYGATSVCGASKTPRQRERVIVLIVHELWRHPLRTFRLCLHVGINARWVSVTYFLLGQHVPQCSTNVDAAACVCPFVTSRRSVKKAREVELVCLVCGWTSSIKNSMTARYLIWLKSSFTVSKELFSIYMTIYKISPSKQSADINFLKNTNKKLLLRPVIFHPKVRVYSRK